MALTKQKKKEVIKNYKAHDKDTGSTEVQVALLTERINTLTDHFKFHKSDCASRLGLLKLVSQRKRLLDYLRSSDKKEYEELVSKLNLRK